MGATREAATRVAAIRGAAGIRAAAIRVEAAILAVLQNNRPNGKKVLQGNRPADRTADTFRSARRKLWTISTPSIAEELRTQFMLGYTPPKDQSTGYHSIHLTTKNKDLMVQTREGYYSGQEKP